MKKADVSPSKDFMMKGSKKSEPMKEDKKKKKSSNSSKSAFANFLSKAGK